MAMLQTQVITNLCLLKDFRKMEETSLIFSQGSVTVLKNMANYEEARVKLTNTQLNKLKSAVKIRLEFA